MFNRIKNTNCQNVINLFTYYEKTWINNSNWSLNEITQWRNHIRTNNDAERFHMKLNHDWRVINSRIDLEDDDENDIENDEDSNESE